MLKKLTWTLSLIGIFSFISCGGGSSEEAKELLQRVLHLVGIPQNVVMNICQDSNNNDFCESVEIKAKVTLNKGDSMATIWEKISQTAEGKYLLETATPCTPILLELEDSDVEYDDGQFTLKYSGIEFGKTSKELSVLEAMVDGEYIPSYSVKSIKELNSTEAQNSLYATLYRDLKTNLNTLRAKGLTKTQAMRGTLKEMADELLSYHVDSTLPNRLNRCNDDIGCVISELDRLSTQLIIDNNETESIVNAQKDNPSSMEVKKVSCVENNNTKIALEDTTTEDNTTELLLSNVDSGGYKSKLEYDENNRLVKLSYAYLFNIFEYDSKGRHIRTVWGDNTDDFKIKTDYIYEDNRLKEIKEYTYTITATNRNHRYILSSKEIFSEWNAEDKPRKIKFIGYSMESGDILKEGTLYIDYTDGNPTHSKGNLRHESSLDVKTYGEYAKHGNNIVDFEIRRTFDDKKLLSPKNSPLYYSHGFESIWIQSFNNNIFRNNNILTEEIVINAKEDRYNFTDKTIETKEYFHKYDIKHEYKYNSQDLPIEEVVDTTHTTNRSTNEEESKTYTYTYIEANEVE